MLQNRGYTPSRIRHTGVGATQLQYYTYPLSPASGITQEVVDIYNMLVTAYNKGIYNLPAYSWVNIAQMNSSDRQKLVERITQATGHMTAANTSTVTTHPSVVITTPPVMGTPQAPGYLTGSTGATYVTCKSTTEQLYLNISIRDLWNILNNAGSMQKHPSTNPLLRTEWYKSPNKTCTFLKSLTKSDIDTLIMSNKMTVQDLINLVNFRKDLIPIMPASIDVTLKVTDEEIKDIGTFDENIRYIELIKNAAAFVVNNGGFAACSVALAELQKAWNDDLAERKAEVDTYRAAVAAEQRYIDDLIAKAKAQAYATIESLGGEAALQELKEKYPQLIDQAKGMIAEYEAEIARINAARGSTGSLSPTSDITGLPGVNTSLAETGNQNTVTQTQDPSIFSPEVKEVVYKTKDVASIVSIALALVGAYNFVRKVTKKDKMIP